MSACRASAAAPAASTICTVNVSSLRRMPRISRPSCVLATTIGGGAAPRPGLARRGGGAAPQALDVGDELPDLLLGVIAVGRHLGAAHAVVDGAKDLGVLVAVQEHRACERGRTIALSARAVTRLAGSIEEFLSRGNRRGIVGEWVAARLDLLRDERRGDERCGEDAGARSKSRADHDRPRRPVFSYHLRFAVADPMQTMSGRLSALRSATAQPAPAIPSSSTLFSQVFARGSPSR